MMIFFKYLIFLSMILLIFSPVIAKIIVEIDKIKKDEKNKNILPKRKYLK